MTLLGAKLVAARAAGAVSRRAGRGGTSLPGKLLLRMEPGAVGSLAARLANGSAVISATNGKTTTAAMVASILERGGHRLVHNRAGANMAGGIAGTLLEAAGRGRSIDGDTGLFEIDEFWLDRLVPQIRPRALLLANLFRDQLDRYGELETIADRWAGVVAEAKDTTLVLNADDPLVADLGRQRDGVVYFGVEDPAMALAGMAHAADSKHCRRCGAPYRYDYVFLGHLGHYHCDACGATRPAPAVAAERVVLDGVRGARVTLRLPSATVDVALPLPGLYNVYNALGAAALTTALGATPEEVVAGLEAVAAAFGRAETVQLGGRDLLLLLVKNPAGANEVLRTLALEPGEHDVLAVLNDHTADGRDVSWVWDADFEVLAGRLRRVVCSGTRAAEMALRFKYAGVAEDRLVVEPELPAALDRAVGDGTGRLVAIPTYTAMLELRRELVARGAAGSSFG
ncbi:Lipid II isoglutaminyl synthase (glutamine-hydrolyzing) subunit MurT [Baekduia alba]|uniref:Mur ligase family protein n=1 Tax=Baekduia alba TaxID=2997333 RepID=UPI00233FA52E|nr:Mur ligase family protein [Baekduia alba]WCB94177.1 Lipid II isoglutaminyl synthase (glutamine-hydrolyzing) subunit MurT [Baekduia alba]